MAKKIRKKDVLKKEDVLKFVGKNSDYYHEWQHANLSEFKFFDLSDMFLAKVKLPSIRNNYLKEVDPGYMMSQKDNSVELIYVPGHFCHIYRTAGGTLIVRHFFGIEPGEVAQNKVFVAQVQKKVKGNQEAFIINLLLAEDNQELMQLKPQILKMGVTKGEGDIVIKLNETEFITVLPHDYYYNRA